ncbi:MAG: response regulator [Arenicellales bacterium]
MNMKHKIYLVDDDDAVRHALGYFLQGQGYTIELFDSAESFLAQYHEPDASVLVLDLRMGGMSGLELQEKLKELNINCQIVFITGHGDIQLSVMAMKAGAISFLEKPFSNQDLLSAIEEACLRALESNDVNTRRNRAKLQYEGLTPREQEVMSLMVQGKMNKEIASALEVSIRTIEVHRSKVMQKMNAQSLPDLVRVADLCDSSLLRK